MSTKGKPMINDGRMKPILILPTGTMQAEDIKRLNDNGICTVECKEPHAVKFLDPIPSAAERTRAEDAAIQLSRKLLNKDMYRLSNGTHDRQYSHAEVSQLYVSLLVKGTALDSRPSQAEQEQQIFDIAKREEIARIARQEAKDERAAARAAKEKAAKEAADKKGK